MVIFGYASGTAYLGSEFFGQFFSHFHVFLFAESASYADQFVGRSDVTALMDYRCDAAYAYSCIRLFCTVYF